MIRRPMGGSPVKMNTREMEQVKRVATKVMGGVKKVGRGLKNIAKWPAKQIEKEWRGEDNAIEEFKYKKKREELGLD